MSGETGATGETGIVEIRVHGVGDQSGYRALGDPEGTSVNGWVKLRRPPVLPSHPLRLINWWRANRRKTGRIWWYLAFPFTLVNVAGRMSPEPGHPFAAALHRAVVLVTGVLLTLTQLAWAVVLVETFLRYLPGFLEAHWLGLIAPLVVGAALSVLLILRWRGVVRSQREDPGTPLPVLMVHVVAAMGGAVALSVLRPAQLSYAGWPSIEVPGSAAGPQLDAMALWIAVTITVSVLLSLLLCLSYALTPAALRSGLRPLPMTGLVLTVAVTLMHTITALVRMGLDNLINYVSGLLYPGHREALGYQHRVLLSYDNPALAGDSRLDLFPIQAAILLLGLLGGTLMVVSTRTELRIRHLFAGEYLRAIWWHDFIRVLPTVIPWIVPCAGFFGMAGVTTAVLLGEGNLGGPVLGLGVLLLQLSAAVVILSVLLGQFPAIREVMAKIGDLAGFWPVHDHPLAGTSYREPVVEGIRLELQRCGDTARPVLFGHSQGSVLCAWLLAHEPAITGPRPVFVSAGSPLDSLYAPFFPTYFTEDFQKRVAASVIRWANFWRATDPLGGPVSGAGNVQLPDSTSNPQGHGEYWDNPRIAAFIAGFDTAGPVFPPESDYL